MNKLADEVLKQALALDLKDRAAIVVALIKSLQSGMRRKIQILLQRIESRLFGINWRRIDKEWERGKRETMLFWSARAADPNAYQGFRIRFDPNRPVIKGVAKHIAPGAGSVRILDVGSGPATNLGYKFAGRAVEVTCIDVMAEPFAELLQKHGLSPPVTPIFGTAEGVGDQFLPGHFDVVMSRNALDHVRDPFKALTGMLAVAKPDGCVIVWGHVNEGENEMYRGYHQWNFCWEDDDFIIWRPSHRQSVRTHLGGNLHFKSEGSAELYRIVISRHPIA